MASTHFSGPVVSPGGFTGAVAGAVTGNVTGDVNGYVTRQTESVAASTAGRSISADTDFAILSSANAAHIVKLPAPVVGKVVRGAIAGTGCEITSSAPASIAVNGVTGAAVEAALAANASFEATCVGTTKWILLNYTSTGVDSNPVPD